MNQLLKIENVEIADQSISSMRTRYLTELAYGQELFLENLINESATALKIWEGQKAIGYALITGSTILEVYLPNLSNSEIVFILTQILKGGNFQSVLCKSFDQKLVDALLGLSLVCTPSAWLFRQCTSVPHKLDRKLSPLLACEENMETIFSVSDDFFTGKAEIKSYLNHDARLFIYSKDEQPVGCGIIKRVVSCRDDYDIGMVVSPPHRQKGYATEIIAHLRDFCIAQSWNPIAGCEISNIASRRALERSGFHSEHQLLKFSVD